MRSIGFGWAVAWALGVGPAYAQTELDPMIGIRFAHYVAQSALASPPLPNLVDDSDKENLHVSPSVSYLPGRLLQPADNTYEGTFTDWSFGLGVTHDTTKKLSFFGFGMVSRMQSEVHLNIPDDWEDPTTTRAVPFLDDMENLGYNFAGGLSYRLWSMRAVPMALGIMVGPYYSKFKSEFQYVGGDSPLAYSAEPSIYGAVAGAQAYLKLWWFKFRPYVVYYRDFSNRCEGYDTDFSQDTSDDDETTDACTLADSSKITLDGTFWAYGLRVGLAGLSVAVYQKIHSNGSFDSIRGTRYSASYTFDF